ncbi:MAG: DUF1461 domain-containing protein [Chloroflexi bacterium]|nr:DUF1461 domain-containing protein [Chloroflexota bacterium]
MSPLLNRILKILLALLVPLIVMIGSAQLLATDTYLAFEYGKASFPLDTFGYTKQQRFNLASANTSYVRDNLPSEALSSQMLDGKPVYSQREVTHMADVQSAYQSVVRFEPGSWLFAYSDTLIRLFPLQFWMDATFMITVFSLIGGLLAAFIGWRWRLALGREQA